MEIDKNWKLGVRPYGLLPFVVAAIALVNFNLPSLLGK